MSVDFFNPPEPEFAAQSFSSRRADLVSEIKRGRRPHQRWRHRLVGPSRRQPAAALAAVVLAALIPVSALAVANDWWFFQFGGAPAPITDVVVVKTGTWGGTSWELTAYRSGTDGICFSMVPTSSAKSTGTGGGMNCDRIEGVPATRESKTYRPHAISYLSSVGGDFSYIVGPVTDKAEEVRILFADGTVIRTPTFDAPKSLDSSIRFYATQLAYPARLRIDPADSIVTELLAVDSHGGIVARMTFRPPRRRVHARLKDWRASRGEPGAPSWTDRRSTVDVDLSAS